MEGKAYKIYVVDIHSEDEQKEKLHITNEKNTNKVLEYLQSNDVQIAMRRARLFF